MGAQGPASRPPGWPSGTCRDHTMGRSSRAMWKGNVSDLPSAKHQTARMVGRYGKGPTTRPPREPPDIPKRLGERRGPPGRRPIARAGPLVAQMSGPLRPANRLTLRPFEVYHRLDSQMEALRNELSPRPLAHAPVSWWCPGRLAPSPCAGVFSTSNARRVICVPSDPHVPRQQVMRLRPRPQPDRGLPAAAVDDRFVRSAQADVSCGSVQLTGRGGLPM